MMKFRKTASILSALLLTLSMTAACVVPALAETEEDMPLMPVAAQEITSPTASFEISVNDEALDTAALIMVPARKVAESLGFSVTWLGNGRFTLDDGAMITTVTLGEDAYYMTSSTEGLAGAAYFSLGIPPYCVDGVSYVPLALFEALTGNVEGAFRMEGNRIMIEAEIKTAETLAGGWTKPESDEVTEEARAALEKALEGMVGAHYEPLALMGTQIVAGMNYCILCEITPVVPDAEGHKTLVYVYVDLDGNAAITEVVDYEDETADGAGTQIANPFVDYATLAEAEKAAGFELTAPDSVEGYDGEKLIQVMSNSMIQIIFHDAEDSRLFLRKEAGNGDISGDYNSYAEINTVSVDGREVTLKGNDGLVSVAIWTDGAYTYAVTADKPMARDAMTALVAAVA